MSVDRPLSVFRILPVLTGGHIAQTPSFSQALGLVSLRLFHDRNPRGRRRSAVV